MAFMGCHHLKLLCVLLLALAPSMLVVAQKQCKPIGFLRGRAPKGHVCEECCKDGVRYPKFACSPPVTSSTRGVLTLNDFSDGGDGGDASSCDGKFHNGDVEKVVALSTGWFDNSSRCNRQIVISAASGRSVRAKVVDECDSRNGCDSEHAFQPPCNNNIVDGSVAVWKALGISQDDPDFGLMKITWKDA